MTRIHTKLGEQLASLAQLESAEALASLIAQVSAAYDAADADISELKRRAAESLASAADAHETAQHGVIHVDGHGDVLSCNAVALELLNLPPSLLERPFNISQIAPHMAGLAISPAAEGGAIDVAVAPDSHIKIHAKPLAGGGAALIIEDTSSSRAHQRARQFAEAEYRSLFEHSVCGIYRDQLDGTPVRCNRALAVLNGYESEGEYIRAVTGFHGDWYVDQNRRTEFQRRMREDGRVRDFVSEVYRHSTREIFWITENAWYVRDAEGVPVFIEGTIQDATERITTMAMIERQANTDALTGVANRFQFLKALERETSPGGAGCSLFAIDLDHFKQVNDGLGHAFGDRMLQAVAERLTELAGSKALVARLGGDEFALLAPGLTHPDDIEALATGASLVTSTFIDVDGQTINPSASIGVASFPGQAADAEELLRNADLALYEAKLAGRNRFRIFDTELRSGVQYRSALAQELQHAIVRNELELYYQPIVRSGTAAVVGFEALVRWNHPERGFLPPSEFIPVAEQAGLMMQLGNWAIRRACEQGSAMPAHISIAVNASPAQFRSAALVDGLNDALKATGFDPARLILEVTETVILSTEIVARKVFVELQEMGVQLALDDFGTGYSSLSYLQRYAFNKVKIDRSFVSGMLDTPASLAIVRAILGIGHDLGIQVVAEGVETRDQAEALEREGCRLMQGYLFGKPRPFLQAVNDLAVGQLAEVKRSAERRGADVVALPLRQAMGG